MKKGANFKSIKGKFVPSIPIQNINFELSQSKCHPNQENNNDISEINSFPNPIWNINNQNTLKLKVDGTIYRGSNTIKPNSAMSHPGNKIRNENIQIYQNSQKPSTGLNENYAINSISSGGIISMNSNLKSNNNSNEIVFLK